MKLRPKTALFKPKAEKISLSLILLINWVRTSKPQNKRKLRHYLGYEQAKNYITSTKSS